jgi:DNA-nicking Smr family endonuclease
VPRRSDDEERRLFEKEMEDVRPLGRRTGRAVPVVGSAAPPAGSPLKQAPAPRLEAVERWGERYALLAPGADRKLLRELRQKKSADVELDLHGLRRDEARAALLKLVESAWQAGQRTLLVIHGRGNRSGADGPVLRELLIETLAPLADRILAVSNAPPGLGGGGAALVLLRR